MKKLLFFTAILFSATTLGQGSYNNLTGGCSECSFPSWRTDSEDPERCLNIQPPLRKKCNHLKKSHESSDQNENLKNYSILEEEVSGPNGDISFLSAIANASAELESDLSQGGSANLEIQDTMYCLIRDRNEYGDYKGTRAQFSVWKPNTGFSCCVIVNISKGSKIIARQRVTVTNNKMLRVLIGEVNGITQGVSPCN